MRDITADYKNALIREHRSYIQAGLIERAEHVASVLKENYDHDVDEAFERTDEKPPENAAKPKPATRRGRPPKTDK